MIKILPLFLGLFLTISNITAQVDPCITTDKKQLKAIEVIKKESDYNKVSILLKEAINSYPENAELHFIYAQRTYSFAMVCFDKQETEAKGEQNLKLAYILFQLTQKKCKNFNADCPYYLGSILLSNGDKKNAAIKLNEFIDFPQDDFTRLPSDNSTKREQVQKFLSDYMAEKALLDNPVPFEPKLVANVSTASDEYFPMISPDNDLLFFTRKVDRTNLGDIAINIREEFTVASRNNVSSNFSSGEPLPKPFNDGTFANYGTASLSVDNKEMIICACKNEVVYKQNYLNCDLYTTTFKRSGKGGNDFSWSPLINMGAGINTIDGWEAQPALSADGKLLFYTTLRKGSRDNDIYYCERQMDGSWGIGKPFDVVNTAGKDKSPFFHQDGETLYFVSTTTENRKGAGGLDIFYIRKENGTWTAPKNIGVPINTTYDELGLFVSTNGKLAYYSSMQDGNWNIFSFELYPEARPKEVVILKGELKDENNKAISNAEVVITNHETGEKSTFKVNGDDGKYAAVVKINTPGDLTLTVKKDGYAFNAVVIDSNTINVKKEAIPKTNFILEELKEGKNYSINDILFAPNSYEIPNRSKIILAGFCDYLKDNMSIKIAIHGHTDDKGDDGTNLLLSSNRAEAVKNYLIEKGIDGNRLSSKGFGEQKPKELNDSEENRKINRRTEFQLLKE